jgi:hypothetical protein
MEKVLLELDFGDEIGSLVIELREAYALRGCRLSGWVLLSH